MIFPDIAIYHPSQLIHKPEKNITFQVSMINMPDRNKHASITLTCMIYITPTLKMRQIPVKSYN
jgi:hypothetical protein